MLSTLSASLRKSQRRPSNNIPPTLPNEITIQNTNENNNIYDLYAVCNHHGTEAQVSVTFDLQKCFMITRN